MSNLKKLKSDQKKIWRYLAKHSDPKYCEDENKEITGKKLNIKLNCSKSFCLYCEWDSHNGGGNCLECPTFKKYKKKCTKLGYRKWAFDPTPENARKFYENAIKGT